MKINSVKGFRDVLPDEATRRRAVVEAARTVLENYGYGEIELPLIEKVELFSRSVGESSDIVEKEMYAFEDRDGATIALRPEGTASLVRAYIEGGMPRSHPVARFYYLGAMFRRERPQKGRFRQFSQIGAEFLGRTDPSADAETVTLVADICEAAGVSSAKIEINSLGDAACRPAYRAALEAFGRERFDALCGNCQRRLDRNPLRLLDCKIESCREATADAPVMIDHLCSACGEHHEGVLSLLASAGVEVTANPRMVRGLDYYCRTAFEISAAGLGSQGAVGGGGRYDGLVQTLGGPEVPGIGFAFGLERLVMAAEADKSPSLPDGMPAPEVFLAPLGEQSGETALRLARGLRKAGARVELESPGRKLGAQMKRANKTGARYMVLIGEDELAAGRATVRDMASGSDHPQLFAFGDDAADILATLRGVADQGA